jgi:hypothetical protein
MLWQCDWRKDPRFAPFFMRFCLALVAGVSGIYFGNDYCSAGLMWMLLLSYVVWEQIAHYRMQGNLLQAA